MRLSGPRSTIQRVIRLIVNTLKGANPDAGKGRYFLSRSWKWMDGTVGVYYDDAGEEGAPWIVVEFTGSAWGIIGQARGRRLTREIMALGFHVTRADFALDVRGEGIDLVGHVERSCKDGELTGARVFGVDRREEVGGSVRGEMVSIGKRGNNGSGRYTRVYDKGLETGTAGRGEWVRFEVEQSDDCAQASVMAMLDDEIRWGEVVAGYILGAVDFRRDTGSRELARRPRVEWWEQFIEGLKTMRVRVVRVPSRLHTYRQWITGSVLRATVTRARSLGVEPWDLLRALADGPLTERPECLKTMVHAELEAAIFDGDIVVNRGGA